MGIMGMFVAEALQGTQIIRIVELCAQLFEDFPITSPAGVTDLMLQIAQQICNDPIVVDERFPVGRCDVQLDSSGRAWVLWMRRGGAIELQEVEPGGVRGSPLRIAQSSVDRASGVPTMVRLGQRLLIVWRQGSTLRGALVVP